MGSTTSPRRPPCEIRSSVVISKSTLDGNLSPTAKVVTRMGAIETHIDLEKDLTIHIASGEITADEILRKIHSYYEGEVTRLLIWDLTDADVRRISASDVQDFVNLTNSLVGPRAGGKTALVVVTPLAFGMARMFELSKDASDKQGIGHRTFRDKKTALEWLGVAADD
jgi:hypothetical protein